MKGNGINYGLALIFVIASVLAACEKDLPEEEIIIDFKNITAFIIDDSGSKIIAVNNELFSFQNGKWNYLSINTDLNFSKINDLTLQSSKANSPLWLATDKGLLNYFSLDYLSVSNSELPYDDVSHICFDRNSAMYLAGSNGVSSFIDEKWYETNGVGDMFLNYPITDLSVAENDYAYVTTYGGGVGRFKVEVDGISGATYFDTDWTRLKSNFINTVFIDDTVQWYGTNQGVAVHSSEYTKWDWKTYSTFDGLISDTVIAIVKDHSENMWFGTRKGLSKFDGSVWTNYTREKDNIISDTIEYLAVDRDGSIWIACRSGLSQFKDNEWTKHSK